MEELVKALKEGRAYGVIDQHGHEMSKNELIQIIKEFIYVCKQHDDIYGNDLLKCIAEDIESELL